MTKLDTILTIEEVGKRLHCSRSVVLRLVESGRLKCVDLGNRGYRLFRFRESDIDEFLNQPYQPETMADPIEQNQQPVNMADRIAVKKLRERGLPT